jgi:TolB-like protein/HEAT repeat protein
MKILLPCCALIALHLLLLPSLAQENGSTDSVELQEQLALDVNALAVLPIEILTNDPRAPALAAQAYEFILNELASIAGLYVIGRESVLPYADSTLSAVEVARELGVGNVLESSIRADLYTISLDVTLIDARTGRPRSSQSSLLRVSQNIRFSGAPFDRDRLMPDMAASVAERVESALFPAAEPQLGPQPDPQQGIADAQAIVLDASLSDDERLDALREAWPAVYNAGREYREQRNEALSGPLAIAAAQLAIDSGDSRVRAGVWRVMAGVGDPYLIQPLLHALVNDSDDGVRRAAADTLLSDFLDEPEVRAALEYAAENDASEWVRNEIRLSMLPDTERQTELLAIVSDSTKPEQERLAAAHGIRYDRSPDLISGPKEFSTDAVIAIMDLARNTRSRRTRSDALRLLSGSDDPYLIEPFLIALANDSYEHVRDIAAQGLAEFLDEAGVREALEEASANDPSPLVRRTAGQSLGSIER